MRVVRARARAECTRAAVLSRSAHVQVVDEHNIIGKELFQKETDMNPFIGMSVVLEASGGAGRGAALLLCACARCRPHPAGLVQAAAGVLRASSAPAGSSRPASRAAWERPPRQRGLRRAARAKRASPSSPCTVGARLCLAADTPQRQPGVRRIVLRFKKYVFAEEQAKRKLFQDADTQ